MCENFETILCVKNLIYGLVKCAIHSAARSARGKRNSNCCTRTSGLYSPGMQVNKKSFTQKLLSGHGQGKVIN